MRAAAHFVDAPEEAGLCKLEAKTRLFLKEKIFFFKWGRKSYLENRGCKVKGVSCLPIALEIR